MRGRSPWDVRDMVDEPPLDDFERQLYVVPDGMADPSQDIEIQARPRIWPWMLGVGVGAVITGFVAVAALTGAQPPTDTRHELAHVPAAPITPAPNVRTISPPVAPEAMGKLTQAMRDETVKVEPPAPTPLAVATAAITAPSPSDNGTVPAQTPRVVLHDVAPGIVGSDVAPPALPIDQSLLAPSLTAEAVTRTGRQPVRAVWDSVASGTPDEVVAIDRAGELVEQDEVRMARDVLRPLVSSGNAVAAYALAQTYDPTSLQSWRQNSALSDVRQARTYYRQAQAGGVGAAGTRLDTLH